MINLQARRKWLMKIAQAKLQPKKEQISLLKKQTRMEILKYPKRKVKPTGINQHSLLKLLKKVQMMVDKKRMMWFNECPEVCRDVI